MRRIVLLALGLIGCQTVDVARHEGRASQPETKARRPTAAPAAAPAAAPTLGTQDPAAAAAPVVGPPHATVSDSIGTLTVQFENDTFADRSDNNFTAGFGLAWTSAAVDSLGPDNWFRSRVENELAFLPTVADPAFRKFFQLGLNMEIYTAQDISDPDPPPEAHPYSGIIALDSAVYSVGEDSMNAYYLRLGLVGPATGAEGIQNGMHGATGKQLAMGWDTQLSNEPLVNVFYIHQHRLLRHTASARGFGYDLTANGGGGLGNYYIGANAGAQARVGFALPESFDRSFPLSLYEEVPNRRVADAPFSGYFFVQGIGTAVGRFLPIDGNTFTSSRRGVRDDFFAQLAFGVMLRYERFALTYRTNLVGTYFQHQENDDDFSAVTVSYEF